MDAVTGPVTHAAPPKPLGPLAARLARGMELWRDGHPAEAKDELAATLADARTPPYELDFQQRIQLAMQLGDLHLSAGEVEQAREMLQQEADYAEELLQIVQMTGAPEQKRMIQGGFIQIRDRALQVARIGAVAPEISVKAWVNGEPAALADLRGRVVLLEFWATWCKPCVEIFAKLKGLDEEYAERGLTILALTRHYSAVPGAAEAQAAEIELVRKFIQDRGIRFGVGVSEDDRTQKLYGATGVPVVVLIDRRGVVRAARSGGIGPDFAETLERCLDETGDPDGA